MTDRMKALFGAFLKRANWFATDVDLALQALYPGGRGTYRCYLTQSADCVWLICNCADDFFKGLEFLESKDDLVRALNELKDDMPNADFLYDDKMGMVLQYIWFAPQNSSVEDLQKDVDEIFELLVDLFDEHQQKLENMFKERRH